MEELDQMQRYNQMLQQQLEEEQIRRMGVQNDLSRLSANPEDNSNIINYQLDLTELLNTLYHLLSGHVLIRDSDGNEKWDEPKDDRDKILTDSGVKKLMNYLQFWVNKNTLLSCYDEDIIQRKVYDFGIEIHDLLFNECEHFFFYPSPEELFDKLRPIKSYIVSDEELYLRCIEWSQDELNKKFKHYPIIILALIDSVHSTYLRALKGEERDSLRKVMHISQHSNPMGEMSQSNSNNFNVFKPSTWKAK